MEKHDQTWPEWLAFTQPGDMGTGVFLYRTLCGTRKEYCPNMTYAACIEKAKDALAFQWIPRHVASYEELSGSSCTRS